MEKIKMSKIRTYGDPPGKTLKRAYKNGKLNWETIQRGGSTWIWGLNIWIWGMKQQETGEAAIFFAWLCGCWSY